MPSLLLEDSQKQVVKRKALCSEMARLGIALFEHGPQGVCFNCMTLFLILSFGKITPPASYLV